MSTECPVCIEPYNGNENVLSCRHSLCVNCTDEIRQRQPYQSALNTVGEENVKCPICRQVCEPSYEELVMLVLNLKEEKGHSEKTMEFQLARNKKMVDVLSELMKYREQSKKMLANLIQDNEMPRLLCQAASECQTRTICRCSHAGCNVPACRGCGKKCAEHRV